MNAKEYDIRLKFLQFLELRSRGEGENKFIPAAFYDKLIDGLEIVAEEHHQLKSKAEAEERYRDGITSFTERHFDFFTKHSATVLESHRLAAFGKEKK